MSYTKLDYALAYARNGFKVHPLEPNGKKPLLKGWQEKATSDPEQVTKLWEKYPSANIGVATGSGLVVIDLDTKEHGGNVDGADSLSQWEEVNGQLPPTHTVITPTGGTHLYYLTDKDYKNATGLLPSVDVRGLGGYVVGRGSAINGKAYEIAPNSARMAKASAIVDKLLAYHKQKESTPTATGASPELVYKGERTDFLIRECAKLQDGTKSIETMRAMIRAVNESQLETPLSDEELEREVFPSLERFKPHAPKNGLNEAVAIAKVLELVPFSKLAYNPVKWLINGYIPQGYITLIGGDGGYGKTSLWCNIASAISSGKPSILENELAPIHEQGLIIALSGEDDPESTLKLRLEKYGADQSQVLTLKLDSEQLGAVTIGGAYLTALIETHKPRLVILDPIQQFIKDIDMSKRNEVRRTLQSLTALGKQYGTAFILVVHTNKRDKVGSFRDKLSDSADLWDIARSVLAVGKSSDGDYFISQEKNSYAPLQDTIIYRHSNGIIEKVGTDERHYVELTTGRKTSKQAQKGDCKDGIIDTVRVNHMIPKEGLLQALHADGYTLNMINASIKELTATGALIAERKAQGFGNGVQTIYTLREDIEK